MKENPLVSVVIPTYSRPTFLGRCVDSVLNQSYKNIEVIVVDDNNPNTKERLETENLMDKYSSNSRVIYLQHDRNRNGSAARNTGWRKSKGKYITFLDDDDEIEKTKIEKQVICLESLDLSWGSCYVGYRLLKKEGNNQISSESRSGDRYVDALMRTMFMGSGSNLLLRKSVVDEINGYDESFIRNQDIEFLTRALENYKIAYIPETLLIIHQEEKRVKRTFDDMEKVTKHYLDTFAPRINMLSKEDRERVLAVISLERFRIALYNKNIKKGLKILKENNVSLKYSVRYFWYLLYRKITHKSYGFSGR